MLISKRRIKWGVLVALLLAVVALVRPVRSWFDHALVRQFNSNVSVAQIKYHNKQSVLEIDALRWRKFAQQRAFGLTANKVWAAVEPEPFIDREVVIPHVRMDRAELFLTDSAAGSQLSKTIWHSELAKHIGSINWDEVKQHFSSLLSADEVSVTWSDRIASWVSQSTKIQTELQRIMQKSEDEDNPLRYEEELRWKLQRIDELTQKHSRILSQFSQVPDLVGAECERLEGEMDAQATQLSNNLLSAASLRESQRKIAESLVQEIAQHTWQQFADYGAISHLVATHFPTRTHADYDQDVQVGKDVRPFFKVEDLRLKGNFVRHSGQTPFEMSASVTIDQAEQDTISSSWIYSFTEPNAVASVEVTKSKLSQDIRVDLRLGEAINSPSPSDSMAVSNIDPMTTTDWAIEEPLHAVEEFKVRLAGFASTDSIKGQLTIDLDYASELAGQSAECKDILRKALTLGIEEVKSLTVRVMGSWEKPQFVLERQLPHWLLASIEQEVRSLVSKENQTAESEARIQFESQVASLRRLIDSSTQDGKLVVLSHRQQLNTARDTLEKILSEITGDSFARRYEKETIR